MNQALSRVGGAIDGQRTAAELGYLLSPEVPAASSLQVLGQLEQWGLIREGALEDRAPVAWAEGCDGPFYRSAVVVRRPAALETLADCRGAVCAVNSWDSLSGWQALAARAAPLARDGGFFAAAELTGSHLASAAAVADGTADVASIDAVCWAHIRHYRPETADRLRVLDWTDPAPGLPFAAPADAGDHLVECLRRAVFAMLDDPAVGDQRRTLLLSGAEFLDLGDYACVCRLADRAAAIGQPEPLAA